MNVRPRREPHHGGVGSAHNFTVPMMAGTEVDTHRDSFVPVTSMREERRRILVNVSNHPSKDWGPDQMSGWERVVDVPFPNVFPSLEGDQIEDHLNDGGFWNSLPMNLEEDHQMVFFVAGEQVTTFWIVARLQARGFQVVSATTERVAVENDGVKTSTFRFVKWRTFPSLLGPSFREMEGAAE